MNDDLYVLGYDYAYEGGVVLDYFRGKPSIKQVRNAGLEITKKNYEALIADKEVIRGSLEIYLKQIVFTKGEG